MVKMFLNQFAISLFGLVLTIATSKRPTLRNLSSGFAILFYLFLLYVMTWEIGFKDKNSVDLGKKARRPLTGLGISLCANIPNFFFACAIALGKLLPNVPFFSKFGGLSVGAALFTEGMYTGLLANDLGGSALNSYWWIWFVITIPAMATCALAYWLGLSDIKFTSLFDPVYPESDREPKKRKK